MSKLVTMLWFDHGQAREAADFYARTFPDSHVGNVKTVAGDYPDGQVGNELTIEFTVCGHAFVGLNGGPDVKANWAVSHMVLTDDQEETDRYWNAIVDHGGVESQCGWCEDRWGFFLADHAARAAGGDGRSRPRRRQAGAGSDDDDEEDRHRHH